MFFNEDVRREMPFDNDIDIKWNKSSVEITVHDNKKKSKNRKLDR